MASIRMAGNNVVYYSYFDTVVNGFLIERGMLDPDSGEVIGLVVESGCQYLAPLAFAQTVVAGLRVAKLGNSSVRYEVGLFAGDAEKATAFGHFVDVYVDRPSRRPAPLRATLETLIA